MRLHLTIGLLLLTCGVVEAGDKHKPGDTWPAGDWCNTCEMDKDGNASCTLLYCRGSWVDIGTIEYSPTCYKRMQEAIRKAYAHIEYRAGNLTITPGEVMSEKDWEFFDKVEQECVQ